MKWHDLLFSFVLVSPAIGLALLPLARRFFKSSLGAPRIGAMVSVLRLVAAVMMVRVLYGDTSVFLLDIRPDSGFGMSGLFEADLRRVLFLVISEMVFLFGHYFVDPAGADLPGRRIASVLALLQQVFLPLMLFSSNLFFSCTIQLLLITVGFFGLRWVAHTQRDSESARAAETMLFRYVLLAVLLLIWGVAQLGFSGLNLSLVGENFVNAPSRLPWLWVFCLVVALPVLPWSRWYRILFDRGDDAVTVFAVLITTSVVFKIIEAGSLVYRSLSFGQAAFIYCLGLLGILFSISEFFASDRLKLSLTALSRFFFSAIALSLGLEQTGSPSGAMLIATFISGYMVLALFVSSMIPSNRFLTILLMGFLGFLFGVPGSPVYFLYAVVGAKSFAGGLELSVLFGLVWALYFFSVVHLSGIIFPAAALRQPGPAVLERSVKLRMTFSLFMLLSLSIACWIFGGRA